MLMKLCCAPGCDELALPGQSHCADHHREAEERLKARRASAKLSAPAQNGVALYRSERWRKAARRYLERHPICVDCAELGVIREAREVDHIIPHRGDKKLMWDRLNWQALCKSCHSRKTAREVFQAARGPGVV